MVKIAETSMSQLTSFNSCYKKKFRDHNNSKNKNFGWE